DYPPAQLQPQPPVQPYDYSPVQPQPPVQPYDYPPAQPQPQPPAHGSSSPDASQPRPAAAEPPARPDVEPTGSFRDWAAKLHGSKADHNTAENRGV
ncbi:MAG: hypothetical protein OXL98_05945, partial [Acidimicrobiaceae bacterium]|nr:hypothetical protein [Acidimicrobiaceae bacterium]